ncbi:charged multivesicular body protein 7-like isoform X2 [Pollicipes pollicipes]|nr:charged multivesicular body protein 7-like isoform X2 [Pollicipes pollicipes]
MAAVPANWRESEIIVGGLFGPFRSRHVNPVGYDCKMAFWRQELADECRRHQLLLLNRHRLETTLVVGIHRPSCLQEVFSNLRRTGEMMTEAELRRRCAVARSWTAWGTELLLWQPARLFWSWVKPALWAEPEEDVVLLTALKERSDELYARHVSQPAGGELLLVDQLWRLHDALFATRADLELALLELERNGRATLDDVDGRLAVKFRLDGEPVAPTVTELERGVLRLKLVQSTMTKEVTQLASDQTQLRSSARELLKSGQRELAKQKLRKWKKMNVSLEQKSMTLDNVQDMLDSIEESKYNQKVTDALSRGTAAARGAFGNVTIDRVEQVVADCQEALEDRDEVVSALARPLSPVDASETADLEAELNDLLSGVATPPSAAQRDRSATSRTIAPSQSPGRDRSATPRRVTPRPAVSHTWKDSEPRAAHPLLDSDSDAEAPSSCGPEAVGSKALADTPRQNKSKRKGHGHLEAL